jgi:hypothetical protein
MTQAGPRAAEQRRALQDFYRRTKKNPRASAPGNVARILARFKGRESELHDEIQEKYGVSLPELLREE